MKMGTIVLEISLISDDERRISIVLINVSIIRIIENLSWLNELSIIIVDFMLNDMINITIITVR